MRAWSIVAHSERPSSSPIRSLKPARVRWLTLSSLMLSPTGIARLHVAVAIAQLLLVSLAHAGPGNAVDEEDLLRNSVLRDSAFVGECLEMALHGRIGQTISAGRLLDDQRQRTLAPPVILDANHRRLQDARALRDQILDLQRGHPLTAGLDDVLEAVGDVDIAARADHRDVVGAQVATSPQLFRAFGVVEVALGQPRRTQHDLSGRLAVMRDIVHVLVDDA